MHNVVTPKREHKIVTTNQFLHCTTDWTAVHVRMRKQNTPSVQIQTFNSQLKWKNFDLTLQFRCYRSRPNIHTDCWKPALDVTTVTNLVKQRLSSETNNSFELLISFKPSPHEDRVSQLSMLVCGKRTQTHTIITRHKYLIELKKRNLNKKASVSLQPDMVPWAKMATVFIYNINQSVSLLKTHIQFIRNPNASARNSSKYCKCAQITKVTHCDKHANQVSRLSANITKVTK